MIESFRFDGDAMPNLPCPHDAIIKKVKFNESYLYLYFQHNISEHEAVAYERPGYDSLIIRYHLFDPDIMTYRSINHITRLGRRFGRQGYYLVDNKYLTKQVKYDLEYLYHKVSFNNVMLVLFGKDGEIIVNADVDRVDYKWIK